VLDNPGVVLAAQLDRLRTETIAKLKADGVEYEQRMEELDKLEHPKPLRDFTYELFNRYATEHPWVADHTIRPKAVARELYERAMTFTDYVGHYGLARSEGLLLRYLSDAYKGLVQNVTEAAKTDEVLDLTEWLGETVRQVDSSLLDEWEQLRHPDTEAVAAAAAAGAATGPTGVVPAAGEGDPAAVADRTRRAAVLTSEPDRVTANARAFRVMVRNELFRWVELLARHAYAEVAEREGSGDWSADRLAEAFAGYRAEHDAVGIGPDARSAALFQLGETSEAGDWPVRQVLDDPAGHHDWAIHGEVDRAASDEQGRAVVKLVAIDRHL
jgi:hypothetical protein